MRIAAGTLLTLALGASLPAHAASPMPRAGFDCTRAASRIEKTICADPALRTLDARLASAYADALRVARDRRRQAKAQTEWLRETRDGCADAACLRRAYGVRIDELAGRDPAAGVYDRAFGVRKNRNDPGELTLRALGRGAYRLGGEALWVGNPETGYVNVGDVAATITVQGGRFHMADEAGCRFDGELRRDVLHVTGSTPECGGVNVTFDGDYVRVAR